MAYGLWPGQWRWLGCGCRLCRGRVRDQVSDFTDVTSHTTPDLARLKQLTLLETSKKLYAKCEEWCDSVAEFKRLAMGLATTILVAEVEKPVSDVTTGLKLCATMKATYKLYKLSGITGRQTVQSNAQQAIADIESGGYAPPPSVMLLLQEKARGIEFDTAAVSECSKGSKPQSISAIAPALQPPPSWVRPTDQAVDCAGGDEVAG